jgi:hypothetical protein
MSASRRLWPVGVEDFLCRNLRDDLASLRVARAKSRIACGPFVIE